MAREPVYPGDGILRNLLERNASEFPDRVMVTLEDGAQWTARDALTEAYRGANALVSAGVSQGDTVGLMLGNGPQYLRAWWGAQCLGATLSPLNPALKGSLLAHALKLGAPRVVVAETELADRVTECGYAGKILTPDVLARFEDVSAPTLTKPLGPWDIHHLQMTSGTTGASKMWRATARQVFLTGKWYTLDVGLNENDVFLVDLPLFHMIASPIALACQATGTPIALRSKPSLSRYLEVAKEAGATAMFLVSAMAARLMANPPSAADRDHRIRFAVMAPVPADVDAFAERFGIASMMTAFGSSETGGPIGSAPGAKLIPASCGRARPGFEHRIVDENDYDTPIGETGELVVRANHPWWMGDGYVGDDGATSKAWRNGWFHTGDLFRIDHDGNFFFVDRSKDALRRGGENISSFEVETEIRAFPGVLEVACVAAGDQGAGDRVDDEVKVWIVPEPGAAVDFLTLAKFLAGRMPHYMVPRFYEATDALPLTAATQRVQKHLLRGRGNSPATWDLNANGYAATKAGFVKIESAKARERQ